MLEWAFEAYHRVSASAGMLDALAITSDALRRVIILAERQMCWQPAGWGGAGIHHGSWTARGVASHALLCLGDFTFGTIRYRQRHRPDLDPRKERSSVLR